MNLKNISIILLLSAGASAFVPLESAFASKSQLVEEQSTEGTKIQPAAKQPSESAFPKEKEFVQYVLGLKKAHDHLDQPLEEYGVIISNAINFFKQKIDIEDERHGILSAMEKEANELAASKRLTLDHLSFYALKLMNISKADYKVKFNLFKGLALFRELGDELEDIYPELTGDRLHPWKQSYATNIADNIVVGERLENHRKALEEEQKNMTSKISNMILELNNVQNNVDDYNLKNEQGRQLMEVAATALKRNHSNINDQIDIISAQIAKGASEIGLDLEIDHAYLVLRDKLLEAKTLNDTNVEQLLQEFEAFKKELDKNQSKFNAATKARIEEAEARKLELGKMQTDLDTKTAEALKELNEGIDANTQFRYNFLEVSKRGISLVPYFQERPDYSIETEIDLNIEA
ncbi:MAG: hypothetical protein ACTHJ4_01615, partial [Candidatus Nucleicultricaceae bacterium]